VRKARFEAAAVAIDEAKSRANEMAIAKTMRDHADRMVQKLPCPPGHLRRKIGVYQHTGSMKINGKYCMVIRFVTIRYELVTNNGVLGLLRVIRVIRVNRIIRIIRVIRVIRIIRVVRVVRDIRVIRIIRVSSTGHTIIHRRTLNSNAHPPAYPLAHQTGMGTWRRVDSEVTIRLPPEWTLTRERFCKTCSLAWTFCSKKL
jgi:hypothetical protein